MVPNVSADKHLIVVGPVVVGGGSGPVVVRVVVERVVVTLKKNPRPFFSFTFRYITITLKKIGGQFLIFNFNLHIKTAQRSIKKKALSPILKSFESNFEKF
jgi:hypothetical protein